MDKSLRDVYLRHGINLTRYSNYEAQRLIKILDASNSQIQCIIRKAKAIETKEKYYRVAAEIRRVTKECHEQLDGQVEIDFMGLAAEETRFVEKVLSGANVKADFELPAPKKIWAAAGFGSYSEQGHETFETYLNTLSDNLYKTWDMQVRTGYLTGMTAKQINRAVLGSTDGIDPGQMQVLRRSLESNTKTMVAHLAETARDAVYRENSSLFSGYRYLGTLDTRTCMVCGELDGKIFKEIEDAPALPQHLACRCLLVPVVKGMEDHDEDDTRASMDGPVSANMSYSDWLKTQPDEIVRDILGPTRFAMYKRGAEVSQFVADGRTLTLSQLRKLEGIPELPDIVDQNYNIKLEKEIERLVEERIAGIAWASKWSEEKLENERDRYTQFYKTEQDIIDKAKKNIEAENTANKNETASVIKEKTESSKIVTQKEEKTISNNNSNSSQLTSQYDTELEKELDRILLGRVERWGRINEWSKEEMDAKREGLLNEYRITKRQYFIDEARKNLEARNITKPIADELDNNKTSKTVKVNNIADFDKLVESALNNMTKENRMLLDAVSFDKNLIKVLEENSEEPNAWLNGKIQLKASVAEAVKLGGENAVLHEIGHMLDEKLTSLLGKYHVSEGLKGKWDDLKEALKKDWFELIKKHGGVEEVRNFVFNESEGNVQKYDAITDMIGGLSGQALKGRLGHQSEYWADVFSNPKSKECFAHLFVASNDEAKYNLFNEYFPNAIKWYGNVQGIILKKIGKEIDVIEQKIKLDENKSIGNNVPFAAKTIKEAEEYARKLGIKEVNYTGMDIKVANSFNEALTESLKKFPEFKDVIKYLGDAETHAKLLRPAYEAYLDEFYHMVYKDNKDYNGRYVSDEEIRKRSITEANEKVSIITDPSTRGGAAFKKYAQFKDVNGISFNVAYTKSAKELTNNMLEDLREGYAPKGCGTIKSLFDHEFGHVIDYILGFEYDDQEFTKIFRKYDMKQKKSGLSEYASTDKKEFIAEAWAEYCNNPKPREIAEEVGKYIEKRYKEWKQKNS